MQQQPQPAQSQRAQPRHDALASEKRPVASGRSAVRTMRASVLALQGLVQGARPCRHQAIPSSVSGSPRCTLEMPDCSDPR